MHTPKNRFGITSLSFGVFACAVVYGIGVALTPTRIFAEVPSPTSLRDQVMERICDSVAAYHGCDTSDGDDDDTGGGGSGGDGGSGGGDTGSGGGSGGSGARGVTITIRSPGGVITSGELALPSSLAQDVLITPTAGGSAVAVKARSALALLTAFDARSDAFQVNDLRYFSAYASFFVRCITPAGADELCDSWQFSVDGAYPSVGLDKYLLERGDHLYLFFGSPRIVEVPSDVRANEPFTTVAKVYDPAHGVYVPVSGYTIGIVQDNPADPWTPIVVKKTHASGVGEAVFTLSEPGSYKAGIEEDGYFPATPFSVGTGGSGGGGGLHTSGADMFDHKGALAFIVRQQEKNGSFGPALFTDWAVLALVAGDATSSVIDKVRTYLAADTTTLSSATDYERRAMALLALGSNPHDLISHIRGYFDGKQIGDPVYVNDDIFALIVLERAGYEVGDTIVAQTLAHVLGTQRSDGSFEGSIDLTSAAIQALVPFKARADVATSVSRAVSFLHTKQEKSGGFGNGFATSWVLQAIAALGEKPQDWRVSGKDPLMYLASLQREDGSIGVSGDATSTRLWETSYAVPAALGKTWKDVLKPVVGAASSTIVRKLSIVAPIRGATSTRGITGASGAGSMVNAQVTGAKSVATSTKEAASVASTTPESEVAQAAGTENDTSTLLRVLAGLFMVALIAFGVAQFRRV